MLKLDLTIDLSACQPLNPDQRQAGGWVCSRHFLC